MYVSLQCMLWNLGHYVIIQICPRYIFHISVRLSILGRNKDLDQRIFAYLRLSRDIGMCFQNLVSSYVLCIFGRTYVCYIN